MNEAEHAFALLVYHGWGVSFGFDDGRAGWYVCDRGGYKLRPFGGPGHFRAGDPVAAILAAEAWWREHRPGER